MNKELLLSCALLALPAPQASADGNGGLDLTAVACNTNTTPPPLTTFNFDCADPGTPQTLYACFQITTTQDSVVGLDAHLECGRSGSPRLVALRIGRLQRGRRVARPGAEHVTLRWRDQPLGDGQHGLRAGGSGPQ